jgi:isopenicillin N synthase-like dioxygenase
MPSRAQRRLAHAGRALAPLQASAAAAAIAPPDPPASSAAELSPIPSIDVSSLFGEDLDAKLHTAREIAAACEDIGFFSIYNHGVPREVIAAAWEQTAAFFALPEATKLDGTTMTDDYPYGYLPLGGEKLAAGKQHELGSDDDSGEVDEPPGDLNESFSIGPPTEAWGAPQTKWPREPTAFKAAWTTYYQAMEVLSAGILRAFALALELPEGWFEDKIDEHRCALRTLNYPELAADDPLVAAPKPGQLRAGAHTDYGTLTLLLQGVGGEAHAVSVTCSEPLRWIGRRP